MNKLIKWFALIAAFFLIGAAAATAYQLYIQSTGTYRGEEITADPTTIIWGDITTDIPTSRLIKLTNTGNIAFTHLTITNSTTDDITYTLTCNATGTPLPVGASIHANFTLTITSGTYEDFQIDIDIGE